MGLNSHLGMRKALIGLSMVVVPDQCVVMSNTSASDQKTLVNLKYRTNIKGAKLVTVIGIPFRNLGILSFKIGRFWPRNTKISIFLIAIIR